LGCGIHRLRLAHICSPRGPPPVPPWTGLQCPQGPTPRGRRASRPLVLLYARGDLDPGGSGYNTLTAFGASGTCGTIGPMDTQSKTVRISQIGIRFKSREARDQWGYILNIAEDGSLPIVQHERIGRREPVVLVRRDVLNKALRGVGRKPILSSVHEGSVSLWIDGVPVHAIGKTLDEAEEAFVEALLDYADLWMKELKHAPNHQGNWAWVQLAMLFASEPELLRSELFPND